MSDEPPATETAPSVRVGWEYRAEAWLATLLIGALGLLPLRWASALGGAAGRLIGPRLGISKRARFNLEAALPELDRAAIKRITRGMWDNLGRVVFEYPHLKKIKVFGGDRIEVHGLDNLQRALAAGRQVIMFSAHLGNWEIAALAGGQYGIDVAQIYRAANNPLIDAMLARLRGDAGELIPKGAIASRRAVAALRRGGHLSLLVDQKLNDGIAVPFFGRNAMTAPAIARFSLKYGCPLVPVRAQRLGGARFRITVLPPIRPHATGDPARDVLAIMTAVNTEIETWVRDCPEQWLWVHRRWPD